MKPTIEYRVRPVTRYIVTRFETSMEVDGSGRVSGSVGSSVIGEFENQPSADFVAEALAIVQGTADVAPVERINSIAMLLPAVPSAQAVRVPEELTGPQTPA